MLAGLKVDRTGRCVQQRIADALVDVISLSRSKSISSLASAAWACVSKGGALNGRPRTRCERRPRKEAQNALFARVSRRTTGSGRELVALHSRLRTALHCRQNLLLARGVLT